MFLGKMNKEQLRSYHLDKRKKISPEECSEMSRLISENFLEHFQLTLSEVRYLHTYIPITAKNEVDTAHIIAHIRTHYPTITIALSKTNFKDCSMQLFEYTKDTILVENSYGILEPESGKKITPELIDLVLVPLLAVDENGNRIGYGKGFYDRFLKQCKAECIKVGLSFEPPITPFLPDQYDVPIDFCITTKNIVPLRKEP